MNASVHCRSVDVTLYFILKVNFRFLITNITTNTNCLAASDQPTLTSSKQLPANYRVYRPIRTRWETGPNNIDFYVSVKNPKTVAIFQFSKCARARKKETIFLPLESPQL